MTIEDNIATVRRLIDEGFTAGNIDICDQLIAPDAIEHQRGLQPGIEGAKQTIRTLRSWFSDFKLTILDVATTDDTVWFRNRATGINTGNVFGRPATGLPIDITVIDIVRLRDARIVEHWGVPDQLGMLSQLGLFGRPESAVDHAAADRLPVAPLGAS